MADNIAQPVRRPRRHYLSFQKFYIVFKQYNILFGFLLYFLSERTHILGCKLLASLVYCKYVYPYLFRPWKNSPFIFFLCSLFLFEHRSTMTNKQIITQVIIITANSKVFWILFILLYLQSTCVCPCSSAWGNIPVKLLLIRLYEGSPE